MWKKLNFTIGNKKNHVMKNHITRNHVMWGIHRVIAFRMKFMLRQTCWAVQQVVPLIFFRIIS